MDISIIIPCHNRREQLKLTLERLCQQTYSSHEFEVIVIDQASIDGSRELVRSIETPYSLRLVEQDQKYGISVARNTGLEVANYSVVLILDADIIPEINLISAHVNCRQANPSALIYGRVMPYYPAYTTFIERSANPEAGYDHGNLYGPKPFYQAFGNNMSLTRSIFLWLGPFDPNLKGFEDIEFAYRASQLGTPIINCPEAVGFHNHPRSLEERCNQVRIYNQMIPIMLQRYPDLYGTIPGLRDYEPINLTKDKMNTIWPKVITRIYGSEIVRMYYLFLIKQVENHYHWQKLAKYLYWRLIKGYGYLGFSEGRDNLSSAK